MIRDLTEVFQPPTIGQGIFNMIKYNKYHRTLLFKNNGSAAIIMAVLLLAVLTIIGIASINNSTTETGIATNDMIYKDAFTEADGGSEVGRELLEQNIACLGFTGNGDNIVGGAGFTIDTGNNNVVDVVEIANEVDKNGTVLPWMNDTSGTDSIQNFFFREKSPWIDNAGTAIQATDVPSDTVRDFSYPFQSATVQPAEYTNVISYGITTLSSGSAVQMAAGYDGKGKSAASGGGKIVYQIDSEFNGLRDNFAIKVRWRHLIGHEDTCIY